MANNKTCGKRAEDGYEYCYTHLPLFLSGYKRKGSFSPQLASHNIRQSNNPVSWKAEIDRDLERSKVLHNRHGKRRWKPEDFPATIDGLWFESIDDFYYFYTGEEFEEIVATDQEYFAADYLPPVPTYRHRDKFRQPLLFRETYSNYEPPKWVPPEVTLEPASWRKLHTIMHMNYCVVRLKDEKYHAVWVSLDKSGHLCDLMHYTMTHPMPCSVTETEWGRYHSSRDFYTFAGAEGEFSKGGESFSRIQERIKRVSNPDWIPPNIRALAAAGDFEFIPEQWQIRMQQWAKDGCPGWYGKKNKAGEKTQ